MRTSNLHVFAISAFVSLPRASCTRQNDDINVDLGSQPRHEHRRQRFRSLLEGNEMGSNLPRILTAENAGLVNVRSFLESKEVKAPLDCLTELFPACNVAWLVNQEVTIPSSFQGLSDERRALRVSFRGQQVWKFRFKRIEPVILRRFLYQSSGTHECYIRHCLAKKALYRSLEPWIDKSLCTSLLFLSAHETVGIDQPTGSVLSAKGPRPGRLSLPKRDVISIPDWTDLSRLEWKRPGGSFGLQGENDFIRELLGLDTTSDQPLNGNRNSKITRTPGRP